MRARVVVAVVLLLAAFVVVGAAGSSRADAPPAGVDIAGVDLHDGTMVEQGGVFYDYGTEYGCGFTWKVNGTPWCGFGVATATSLAGPWSAPTSLFSPTAVDPYTGLTWAAEAGWQGRGMFEPRMIQRSGWGANDGVWILLFADIYLNQAVGGSAYIAMGCNGPGGPCGYSAPFGTVHRMAVHDCVGDGDASYVTAAGHEYMVCTTNSQTLSMDELNTWGTDTSAGIATNLAGWTAVESSGVYQDTGSGLWIMTAAWPNCAYCQATGTVYAVATSPTGPYVMPGNRGQGNQTTTGRAVLSGTSCGGQADTVGVLAGQAYERINLWTGAANETAAGQHYEPLTFLDPNGAPGTLWQPFTPWLCD